MSAGYKSVEANGIRFAYLEQGSGPLVLLLHGFPDTARTWEAVMPALAKAGWRAVAPNLRGYPPTAAPADGDYSVLRLGEDVLALIDALGAERAVVVGHDWGAISAHMAANMAPERIAKLVTLAIPHPRAIPQSPKVFRKAWHFLLFQIPVLAEWLTRRRNFALIDRLYWQWSPNWTATDKDLEPVKEALRAPGGLAAAIGYYRAFLRAGISKDRKRVFALANAKVSVPTLAFAGLADGAADAAWYDRTEGLYTGPYEIARFGRAGHFLHREAPKEFTERLLAFLGRPE